MIVRYYKKSSEIIDGVYNYKTIILKNVLSIKQDTNGGVYVVDFKDGRERHIYIDKNIELNVMQEYEK